MAMAGGDYGGSPFGVSRQDYDSLTDAEKAELEERTKVKYKSVLLKKGIKEWNIDGVTVLAINEKNAQRKAKNIKEQLKKLEQ